MTLPLNILVFGQNGQLARALARLCETQKITAEFIGSSKLDLAANPEAAREAIKQSAANVVINAAAYTQVDKAETDRLPARNLNEKAPAIMACTAREQSKAFIHISTDYVFKGESSAPYHPDDPIAPLNAYGASKADGEIAMAAIGGRSVIIRTSWVYDGTGANFLTTMLRLAATRSEISVVHDQIGRPTYAYDLAQACLHIAKAQHSGEAVDDIYHVSNSGEPISWADFARAIFKAAGVDCHVKNIPSSAYPTAAKRPAYSLLDISDYESRFSPVPAWYNGLTRALSERDI